MPARLAVRRRPPWWNGRGRERGTRKRSSGPASSVWRDEFDEAADLLKGAPPAEWRAVHANEEAALAWHRGRADEAAALWQKQPESVPVLFNRGMAALFLGDAVTAHEALTRTAAALPETGAWHHLSRLYLALAAARG